MCGLCGEVSFDGASASLSNIERMCDVMRPRGPDSGGAAQRAHMAFGHRRLRIIDLSDHGHQPMIDPALGLTLAFNGCIYNYPELRQELIRTGYSFFSTSDTEVILKAYAVWGIDCVKRFNGMFAFAIHEHDSGRLILARDRLGIKPLYLSETNGGKRLRFASSLPALTAIGDVDTSIDPVALHHYMTWHAVVPAPFTMLNGVRKLPPATISVFERDGRRQDHVYWNPSFNRRPEDHAMSAEDWEDAVHNALRAAVKRRMIADVPVGVLLSGGVDSSLIVALLDEAGQKDINTFSIGFDSVADEEGNEFIYSDIVAERFQTKHHKISVGSDRMISALPQVIEAMSEPMVSHDNVGFYLLSEQVSKHVKVVQSGQGADEIFAGYHWYPKVAESNDAVASYSRAFFDRDDAEYRDAVSDQFHSGDHSRAFIEKHFSESGADEPVDKALRLDSRIMLTDDPVKRVDNMTMAWGLEARVPFLDHEVVELAARVPSHLKLAEEGKGVLKRVARRVVPKEVIDRPKGYFPVPALKYLQGDVLEMVRDSLSSDAARNRGLFKRDYIDKLLASPKDHITPLRGSKLWQVSLLELWLQKHNI
jgi:asparagine synthase (glutamine-hydrolysing)